MKPTVKPPQFSQKSAKPKQFDKASQMAKVEQLRKPKAPMMPEGGNAA